MLATPSRARAIDSRDARSFQSPARRTAVLRIVLAGAAIALLAAAVATARNLDPRDRGLLPTGTTGVVVLDVSLSILDDRSGIVRGTLRRLVDADAPVGLVVFSDVPYELLPPGSPSAELRPLIRLLTPPVEGGNAVNPWTDAFRAGTRISTALQLAHDMLEGDRVKDGSILLVSDLETAPDDVPETARVLRSIQREGIQVRLLALGPSSDARALFGGILGPKAFTPLDSAPDRSPELTPPGRRPVPQLLLVLGALVFGALAAHERFAGRLALPAAARRAA
jgi:hypothetical protein